MAFGGTLIEMGKSGGEEKCALRRFKEESKFRFRYVKFAVSYGRGLVGLFSRW